MNQLFRILSKYQIILLFLLLEAICGWLIVQNNRYQSAVLFVKANHVFAYVYQLTNGLSRFAFLGSENEKLQQENAYLRTLLNHLQTNQNQSTALYKQQYISAKVIDNSVVKANNYLLIDKGSDDGVKPGMGLVTANGGVVGKVKDCSKHFSTVYSLLHTGFSISSKVKGVDNNSGLCTTKWTDPSDPTLASIQDLSLHSIIKKNDTIVTSGYSGVFPDNYLIGQISTVEIDDDGGKKISIKLETDFNNLSYVYVIKTENKDELDSLRTQSIK